MQKARYAIAALLTLTAAGVALAQPAPPAADGQNRPAEMGRDGPGYEGEGRMGHHGWMMRHMMETKAARFDMRRGDMRIDVKCAADEPMKACVDAATTLMDKMAPK